LHGLLTTLREFPFSQNMAGDTNQMAKRFGSFTQWTKEPYPLIPVLTCACVVLGVGSILAQHHSHSAGEMTYRSHCLRCHGKTGDGRGPDSAPFVVPPGDFHSPESTAKSKLELRAIIIWGLVFSPMHGWWDRLSSKEIRDVINYIRQLAPINSGSKQKNDCKHQTFYL
jgi:mono/diheme cytochrome c family protein